jgi:hypothetical protein
MSPLSAPQEAPPQTAPTPPAPPPTAPVAPDFGEISSASMPSFDFDGYAAARGMTSAGLESLIDSGLHNEIMQDMMMSGFAGGPAGAFTSAASQYGSDPFGGSSMSNGFAGAYGSSAYGGYSGGYGGYGNQADYANYGR